MKKVHEHIRGHIEYVKGRPRHIREKVAFAVAAACTALVALVWLASSLSAGTFAIKSSPMSGDGSGMEAAPARESGTSGLAGAAAALPDGGQKVEDTSAHIEIVDVAPPAKEAKKSEQTIIPF